MEKLVSERLHVSGLVIRVIQADRGTFFFVTANDSTGLTWPTIEGGTDTTVQNSAAHLGLDSAE